MHKPCKITWSNASLTHATSIKHYLQDNFSHKEIDTFYSLLQAFENAVTLFPELYPATVKKENVRRAVLSRELSAFYRYKNEQIEVLALLDNRCTLSEWI